MFLDPATYALPRKDLPASVTIRDDTIYDEQLPVTFHAGEIYKVTDSHIAAAFGAERAAPGTVVRYCVSLPVGPSVAVTVPPGADATSAPLFTRCVNTIVPLTATVRVTVVSDPLHGPTMLAPPDGATLRLWFLSPSQAAAIVGDAPSAAEAIRALEANVTVTVEGEGGPASAGDAGCGRRVG